MDLLQFIEECADSERLSYIETWHSDFDFIKKRADCEEDAILGGYLLTINDGFNNIVFMRNWEKIHGRDFETCMGDHVAIDNIPINYIFECFKGRESSVLVVLFDDYADREYVRRLVEKKYKVLLFKKSDVGKYQEKCSEFVSNVLSDLMYDLLVRTGVLHQDMKRKNIMDFPVKRFSPGDTTDDDFRDIEEGW